MKFLYVEQETCHKDTKFFSVLTWRLCLGGEELVSFWFRLGRVSTLPMKFLHVEQEIYHKGTKAPSFFVLTLCLGVLVVKSLFHFGSGSSGLGDKNIRRKSPNPPNPGPISRQAAR